MAKDIAELVRGRSAEELLPVIRARFPHLTEEQARRFAESGSRFEKAAMAARCQDHAAALLMGDDEI